jgi:predicted nuclease of predicted toxin-antitoxin system
MKVLLDECVPRGFKPSLSGGNHQIVTVPEAGLAGKTNGGLLDAANSLADVLITLDQGFAYQQNLAGRQIAVIIIRAKSNRLVDLLPHAEACRDAIIRARLGEILILG